MIDLLKLLFWPFIWLYRLLTGQLTSDPPIILAPQPGDIFGPLFTVSGTADSGSSVTVAVTDPNGNAVNASSADPVTANPDWDVSYSIPNPLPGTYNVSASVGGGTPVTSNFTIQTNPPITMDPPTVTPANSPATTTTQWIIGITGNSPSTTIGSLHKSDGSVADQKKQLKPNSTGMGYADSFDPVPAGAYRLHVESKDAGGNLDHTTRKRKFHKRMERDNEPSRLRQRFVQVQDRAAHDCERGKFDGVELRIARRFAHLEEPGRVRGVFGEESHAVCPESV